LAGVGVGIDPDIGVAFDEDCRPFPVDGYAFDQNADLLNDASQVIRYTGARWRTYSGMKFNEIITTTTIAGTVDVLQIAFYGTPDGTMPNGPVPLIDFFVHSGIASIGSHTTAIGKTITIRPGQFFMLFGRDPSSGVGTSIRLDSWIGTDMAGLSVASLAATGLAPSKFRTDILVNTPPPAEFDPTDQTKVFGQGEIGYPRPNMRLRLV